MKNIDLHVHSCYSDGTLTPTELVHLAQKSALSTFALTDHDTIAGIHEALEAAEQTDIHVIPGTELSAYYVDREIHILGLNLNPYHPALVDSLRDVEAIRDDRNQKMAHNLHDAGLSITYEKLINEYPQSVITRAHFARFLVDHGDVSSMNAAFSTYLSSDSPYYVMRSYLTPEHAIKMIRDAGGVAILAHPMLYNLKRPQIIQLVEELKQYGLQGIEAIYSCNRGDDEKFLKELAANQNLIISGGSDFHGDNKPYIHLGTGKGTLRVPYEIYEQIKNESGN